MLGASAVTYTEWTFIDRGAENLLNRELRLGSTSRHNADEREDEEDWLKPCFPRFYFYDVLRGLSFILKWVDRRNKPIPYEKIKYVVEYLETSFPEGEVCIGRQGFAGHDTWIMGETEDKDYRAPASRFPLLEEVSQVGVVSPYLSARWKECQRRLDELRDRDLFL
jgi:hypothetical protein